MKLNNRMMIKISREDFFKIIGKLNVQLSVRGDYPYTILFSLKYGDLVGKTIDRYIKDNCGEITTDYYI